MDSFASIGIPAVGILYATGLVFVVRKIRKNKKEGKEVDRKLISVTIASGVVLVLLIYSYIMSL